MFRRRAARHDHVPELCIGVHATDRIAPGRIDDGIRERKVGHQPNIVVHQGLGVRLPPVDHHVPRIIRLAANREVGYAEVGGGAVPHVRCGPVVRQIQVGDVVGAAFQDYGISRVMVRVHVEKRGGELFHVRHRHRLICRECLRRKGERGHHGNSNSFFHDFLLK